MSDHALITQLLHRVATDDGDAGATRELFEVVYARLREIANQRMAHERPGHTLQATALVHEAFVRLMDHNAPWADRAHFYAASAESMRRILVDHARKRRAEKRGGDRQRVPLSVVDLATDIDPDQVLRLDEAFDRLEREDPRAASVVRLRFYAGLDVATTAATLGISERTVMRDWTFARALMLDHVWGDNNDEDNDGGDNDGGNESGNDPCSQ